MRDGYDAPHQLLVIDDNPSFRGILCDELRLIGHDATASPNGSDGVAQFRQHPHDVVITDLRMPGLSGWDVIDRVRRVDAKVPVILLTGIWSTADTERARAAGICMLQKPVRMEDLQLAVESVAVRSS